MTREPQELSLRGKNRSKTTRIDTKLVNKQSLEVARVDIEQSLIRLTIPPHPEVMLIQASSLIARIMTRSIFVVFLLKLGTSPASC